MSYSKKETWYKIVCYFFIFCVIGWIYEVAWEFKVGNGFVNRGFLNGPYLPVYGFGGLLLIFSLKKLVSSQKKLIWKILTPFIAFVAIILIVSIVEFIASLILEKFFNMKLWDYSYDKFNIQGRVSLRNSTLLAIGGMFFVYILHPILKKIFSRINNKILIISALIIIAVMSTDLVLTLI